MRLPWASMGVGLPSWRQLRNALVEDLRRIANQIDSLDERHELLHLADEAAVESNLWNAFSLLKEKIGEESYSATVKRSLQIAVTIAPPKIYEYLWKLPISGMLTLNIDRLALKSYNTIDRGDKLLTDFNGQKAGDFIHVLRSLNTKWLARLHGDINERSSWVFTSNELKSVQNQSGYKELIQSCLTARTVLFVGITADDVAAGGYLEHLTKSGIDCGGHFWITHRRDNETRQWAENAGIKIISYTAIGDDHSEVEEIFEAIRAHIPEEEIAVPIRPSLTSSKLLRGQQNLLPPKELRLLELNEMRSLLNAHAAKLLEKTDDEHIEKYEEFTKEYSREIWSSWLASVSSSENEVLQYTLVDDVAEGAFGKVYRAEDNDGKTVALKILNVSIRDDHERLQSFRRGVQSMQILTGENVSGIVRYHEAFEIPAMVVMDFIEGINLNEAVKQKVLHDWSHLLFVSTEIAKIIRKSHQLPQRVLHRDIRPANVMLENCWGPNPDWEDVNVKILDFDLSWHLDSYDVSITKPGTTNGYLAPEQINRNSKTSTRNAAVDSYGLGMTLYFLRTNIDPVFSEHLHVDWINRLEGCSGNYPCKNWLSAPKRFFRLIEFATKDLQSERWDMARIEGELAQLASAVRDPLKVASTEMLTEELAARAFNGVYSWNTNLLTAVHPVFRGMEIRLRSDETKMKIHLNFLWTKTGLEPPKEFKKMLNKAKDQIASILNGCGWRHTLYIRESTISGDAEIDSFEVSKKISEYAKAVAEIKNALSFS